jgi:UDP-N-acetylglucosamine 1-carboxyvinyltransferase
MEEFQINGGKKLSGEVTVKAAKNSVLTLIACALLSSEDIVLENVPDITDVKSMLSIITASGGKAEYINGEVRLNCAYADPTLIGNNLTSALRSSIFLLGPILSRFKSVSLGLPGGCAIGARPIDIHIDGLKKLGARICEETGFLSCDGKNMRGGTVELRMPSVGATENLIMASALIKGVSIIKGAAKEPEISDLANFINLLGGKVSGAGSSVVTIEGVKKLSGGRFLASPDRIAAPTFLAAAAAAGGEITVRGAGSDNFLAVCDVLAATKCKITRGGDFVALSAPKRLKSVKFLQTAPYPLFPTDMQSPIAAVFSLAKGKTVIKENLFENRFRFAGQLRKMGAKIEPAGNCLYITGVKKLRPAEVFAEDLRGGAALIIAALSAEGETIVKNAHHIDRGYEAIEIALTGLGASVVRRRSD